MKLKCVLENLLKILEELLQLLLSVNLQPAEADKK